MVKRSFSKVALNIGVNPSLSILKYVSELLFHRLKSMNVTSCCNPDKFVETYKDSPASLQEII